MVNKYLLYFTHKNTSEHKHRTMKAHKIELPLHTMALDNSIRDILNLTYYVIQQNLYYVFFCDATSSSIQTFDEPAVDNFEL